MSTTLSYRRGLLPAVALAGAGLLAAPDSHAYCQTRTCEFRNDLDCQYDADGCSTVGAFVFWQNHCIPFAVQRDGSMKDDISAAALEQLVSNGFDTWSTAQCPGGESPELSSGSQGEIACDAVEYNCNVREDNSNLVMFRDSFANTSVGLRFGVIALTTLTANLVTGELFDADIEINSRDEDFEVGGMGGVGVNPDQPRDLRGVVNHELGHLLGLSHSQERGALMRAQYAGTFEPANDDIRGICAALGREAGDPACTVASLPASTECLGPDTTCPSQSTTTSDSGGCACELGAAPARRFGGGYALGLLAFGFAWRWRGGRGTRPRVSGPGFLRRRATLSERTARAPGVAARSASSESASPRARRTAPRTRTPRAQGA
jgi:Matrixin